MAGGIMRRWALVGSNLILPLAVLIFASGFFPYKPFIAGRNYYDAREISGRPEPIFDRVIFMVVDALRRYAFRMRLSTLC